MLSLRRCAVTTISAIPVAPLSSPGAACPIEVNAPVAAATTGRLSNANLAMFRGTVDPHRYVTVNAYGIRSMDHVIEYSQRQKYLIDEQYLTRRPVRARLCVLRDHRDAFDDDTIWASATRSPPERRRGRPNHASDRASLGSQHELLELRRSGRVSG